LGLSEAIVSTTSSELLCPEAPSPTAVTTKGSPSAGVVPVVGVQPVGAGGGVFSPFENCSPTDVRGVV